MSSTARRKSATTSRLKDDWLTKSQIKKEKKFYVKFPSENIHSGDFTGEVSICKHLLMSFQFKLLSYCFKETLGNKPRFPLDFSWTQSYKLLLHDSLFLYILENMGFSEIMLLSLLYLALYILVVKGA